MIIRAALALFLFMSCAVPGRASEPASISSEPGNELLVRLPAYLSADDARELLAERGLQPLELLEPIDVWRVRPIAGTGASVQSISSDLGDDALWVEENGIASAQETVPNDPYYDTFQTNLSLIGMPQAWDLSLGSGQIVAVIDSGIDLQHPDLRDRLWSNSGEIAGDLADDDGNGYVDDVVGWDFVSGDALPEDGYGHGTHVSGIVGAATGNLVGIAGVAGGSSLMVLRALGNDGKGTYANIALAIRYAADQGARVINLSLGGPLPSTAMEEQVQYAQSLGCLVVAAGGNTGTVGVLYPAAIDGVLAISASNYLDQAYSGNSRGPELDIAAPGVNIYSTMRNGLYGTMTGTSMATPHVSGVAALLRSYRTDLTWQQIAEAITSTAVDIDVPGWDDRTGWGRLDAAAALASFSEPSLPYRLMLPLVHWTDCADCPDW
ncbi:MAG: S8 family peptidase [Anaerolineae bacterium]